MRSVWLAMGLILWALNGEAQFYFYNDRYLDKPIWWEAGVIVGAMNCVTDLGGGKAMIGKAPIDLTNMFPAFGLYLAVRVKEKYELRISGLSGKVGASDNKAASPDRLRRNLHFESGIRELALGFNLFPFTFLSIGELKSMPYFSTGVGYFQFNPKAKLGEEWIELHPLQTEGQGFSQYPQRHPYKLQQINLPVGLGWIWNLLGVYTLRIECLYRKLFTDYLDDVSTRYIDPEYFPLYLPPEDAANASQLMDRRTERQPMPMAQAGEKRGNPANNDGYWTISLHLGYVFNREKR